MSDPEHLARMLAAGVHLAECNDDDCPNRSCQVEKAQKASAPGREQA